MELKTTIKTNIKRSRTRDSSTTRTEMKMTSDNTPVFCSKTIRSIPRSYLTVLNSFLNSYSHRKV